MSQLGFGQDRLDFNTADTLIKAAKAYDAAPNADNWSQYRDCWNLAVMRTRETGRHAKAMPITSELFKRAAGTTKPWKIGGITDLIGFWHSDYAKALSAQSPARIQATLGPRKGMR